MTKEISGDHFIPANLWNRAGLTRSPRVGGSVGTTGSSRSGREPADFEFLKNSINIDKFLKMFMGQTNGILFYELASCRNMLK